MVGAVFKNDRCRKRYAISAKFSRKYQKLAKVKGWICIGYLKKKPPFKAVLRVTPSGSINYLIVNILE
jgi:hypothetical protein